MLEGGSKSIESNYIEYPIVNVSFYSMGIK